MQHTIPITLPDLTTTSGARQTIHFRLGAPTRVYVTFLHEAEIPAIPTLPNGDPGEPGTPEHFEFQQIVTRRSLVLSEIGGTKRYVIQAGDDLHEELTDDMLAAIERAMLTQVRREQEELRIDLIPRELNQLLVGHP